MKHISIRRLTLADRTITYELERKAVKNINLRIRSNETIYVSANPRVPQSRIDAFIQGEQTFISRSLEHMQHLKKQQPPLQLQTGDVLYIEGQELTLRIHTGSPTQADIEDSTLHLTLPHPEDFNNRARLYHTFLKSQAAVYFPSILERMCTLAVPYGISRPNFRLRLMKSRWGSCLPIKKIVTLNTYLAIMPEACVEYVVLHELCHFIHPNHSPRFYALVQEMMPDWRERRAAIKKYHRFCL